MNNLQEPTVKDRISAFERLIDGWTSASVGLSYLVAFPSSRRETVSKIIEWKKENPIYRRLLAGLTLAAVFIGPTAIGIQYNIFKDRREDLERTPIFHEIYGKNAVMFERDFNYDEIPDKGISIDGEVIKILIKKSKNNRNEFFEGVRNDEGSYDILIGRRFDRWGIPQSVWIEEPAPENS